MCVLVVDDDAVVRTNVTEYLELIGYEVVAADDAASALKLVQEIGSGIEAVVTDVQMPGMSGPEMWQKLKEIVPFHCRAIFMTGSGDFVIDDMRVEVLLKPFSLQKLKDKLAATIDPST